MVELDKMDNKPSGIIKLTVNLKKIYVFKLSFVVFLHKTYYICTRYGLTNNIIRGRESPNFVIRRM